MTATRDSTPVAQGIPSRNPTADEDWAITDSFHWDFHETVGIIILGILVLVLSGKLFDTYERLLRAYAAGYTPRDS